MVDYRAPLDEMRFVLFDVLNGEQHWAELDGMEDMDRATAEAVLDEAGKLCQQVIAPLNRVADECGCSFSGGDVTTPAGFIQAYKTFNEGGWGGLGGNPAYGGMGMPKALVSAVEEMLQGACMSFGLAPMLTAGACLALDAHGSEALKQQYLPHMYSGAWSGAMDLTEPHAGTDLGLIRTRAEVNEDGSYAIHGSKIFITWGEHDMAENIVHLVLAKIPGSPEGTRGISMFLVPKFVPLADGSLGQRNSLSCGALEMKMGIKASATCVMNFDGAQGWLIGEANKGLNCMFTMMNYERLVVGIQALGAAQWSYDNAVAYARDRQQSRAAGGPQAPQDAADPIIVHADVRRMLMTARAYNEGSRAFYVYVAQWLDKAKYAKDAKTKTAAQNRVALLTPIAKAFISDMAFDTAVTMQQVFGGHGYIREWGQEQFVRDIRITQIYEGTNGIQAMDLISRKTVACSGNLLAEFITEIQSYLTAQTFPLAAGDMAEQLAHRITQLQSTTAYIIQQASLDPASVGAAAVEYLHFVGHVALAYLWLRMLCTAELSTDKELVTRKRVTAQFYFWHLLPKIDGLASSIEKGGAAVMGLPQDLF